MGHDLTIITLSRNLDYFNRLVEKLALQKDAPEFQGILVNNANSIKLTAAASKAGWWVIEPGHNTTYAEGNNLAAKAAEGHWLLFLNDDAEPEAEWLAALWSHRKEATVVGSLLLNDDGTVNHAGTLVGGNCHTDHIGRNAPPENFTGCPLTPSVTFAAALVLAPTFHELGGLDEQFNYGYEDSDFCVRVLRAGGTVRCARDAVATHGECGTRPKHGPADETNRATFHRKWATSMRQILAQYCADAKPEKVEGV